MRGRDEGQGGCFKATSPSLPPLLPPPGKQGVSFYTQTKTITSSFQPTPPSLPPSLPPFLPPSPRQARRVFLHPNQDHHQQLEILRGLRSGGCEHAHAKVGREGGREGGRAARTQPAIWRRGGVKEGGKAFCGCVDGERIYVNREDRKGGEGGEEARRRGKGRTECEESKPRGRKN